MNLKRSQQMQGFSAFRKDGERLAEVRWIVREVYCKKFQPLKMLGMKELHKES